MRLALMCLNYGSGIDHFIFSHARVMSRLADVVCYLPAESTLINRYSELPCKVKVFKWTRGYKSFAKAVISRSEPTGIAAELREHNPDILLTTHNCYWSSLIYRHLGGQFPIAEIVHDVTPHPDLRMLLYESYRIFHPSLADIKIALSKYTFNELKRKYPGKVHLCSRHGIFHPNNEVCPDVVASMRNKMLFLGRIEPYKGVDVLADAFEIAKVSSPSIELSVVGQGYVRPNTVAKLEKLGARFLNKFVSDEQIKQLVNEHGVMILPYTSATQSGVAAIALGNGLIGIATNVGALPEQIVDRMNGIVVLPGDPQSLANAMVKVAGNQDKARSMSEESLRIGREEYSWDKISTQLLHQLEDYLTEHRHDTQV